MLEKLGIDIKKLALPYRLNHVNCFMAKGNDGYIVIDTGINDLKTAAFWEKECYGKKIEKLFITHYHPDHFGYSGVFQKKYNTEVYMSEIEIRMSQLAWSNRGLNELETLYKLAGVPLSLIPQLLSNYKEYIPQVSPIPKEIKVVEEGQKTVFGNYEYEIIQTPGHSPGLITFYNHEIKVLLGTDHLLGKITPNISYWLRRNNNPLKEYLDSLDRIYDLEIEFVLPSHGKPFSKAKERIEEIKKHHDIRLERILKAVKNGGTVINACNALFENNDLDIHALRSALGETFSHLEYLYINGDCKKEKGNGVWWYYV